MAGMAMPGCTAEQAASVAANSTQANSSELPTVKIALAADGSGQSRTFTVDHDAMSVLASVRLRATSAFVAMGPDRTDDLQIELRSPDGTSTTLQLNGTAPMAGTDPQPVASKGPFNGTLSMPAEGDWKVVVHGQGSGLVVEVCLTERLVSERHA
jgi:subtilisin-like proprotein convertase family protein